MIAGFGIPTRGSAVSNPTSQEALTQAVLLENRRNYKAAIEIYLKLTDEGNEKARERIDALSSAGGNISTAVFDVCQTAEMYGKSKVALQILGLMYEKGYSVGKDKKKAIEYYRLAYKNGIAEAAFSIAALYEKGSKAVPRDLDNALLNYKKADDLGFPDAAYKIADIYYFGEGDVQQDIDQAISWYIKANDQGVLEARNALLGLCIGGDALQRIPDYAMDLLVTAATEVDADGNVDRRALAKLNEIRNRQTW